MAIIYYALSHRKIQTFVAVMTIGTLPKDDLMTSGSCPRRELNENRPASDSELRSGEIELTILMPCLNEAETIGTCIGKATGYLNRAGVHGEILVADNGSTDGSVEIATRLGARVVNVASKGYGAALIGGIEAARGQYTIMGDADDSYDFSALDNFVASLRDGADLVVGNRFEDIKPGAMPFLHRYLGNPVLSFIGRLFFRIRIHDFHCGLRGFRTCKVRDLRLQTTGMEFATEMIVRSALAALHIAEVPTTLYTDGRSRPPHLRTWRDGWRHLKFLLVYSPTWLFQIPGSVLTVMGLGMALLLLFGPFQLGHIVLDLNTLLVACCLTIVGVQLNTFALATKYYAIKAGFLPSSPRSDKILAKLTTENGLLISGAILVTGLFAFSYAVLSWVKVGFGELFNPAIPRILIVGLTLIVISIQTAFSSFLFGIFDIGHKVRAWPGGG